MHRISHEQIERIENELKEAGIKFVSLRGELLDHICIEIEKKMEKEPDFEKVYEQVKNEIEFRKLKDVQQEAYRLLHFKVFISKIAMNVTGIIGTVFLIIFLLGKISSWNFTPLAGMISVFSYLFFIIVLIAFKTYDKRKFRFFLQEMHIDHHPDLKYNPGKSNSGIGKLHRQKKGIDWTQNITVHGSTPVRGTKKGFLSKR